MTLSASLRRAQDFFHDRTQACGLLMNLFDYLFRFLHPDSGHIPARFRLPSRVVVFFAVHNLTDWFHNANFVLSVWKCKPFVILFFIRTVCPATGEDLKRKPARAIANAPRRFELPSDCDAVLSLRLKLRVRRRLYMCAMILSPNAEHLISVALSIWRAKS